MAEQKKNEMAVSINLDNTPILYTDNILLSTNENGLVMDIGQKLGGGQQMRIVSRVGMSRTHAKKLLEELGKLLALTEGKRQTGKSKN